MIERIQKILARAGYGSRRSVESLVAAQRVRINGVIARIGQSADIDADRVEVDGVVVRVPDEPVYLALNKPRGFVTTARDPQGRHTVMELLPAGLPPHVVPVGRLDRDTEGLLLFTNDGELAHRLAHPRYEIDKEYLALVEGAPPDDALEQLRRGVAVDGRMTAPAQAEFARPPHGYEARPGHTWLSLVIHEGRKRQVRRMCAAIGYPVRTLVRIRIGDVTLGKTAPRDTRRLSEREIASLRTALGDW